MRRTLTTAIAASLLGAASLASAVDIDVMTQNQYFGTSFAPVLSAATAQPFDPAAFNAAVVSALSKIAASRPAERVKMHAANIAQRNPDVVGLQEVHKFVCMPITPQVAGQGCEHPSLKAAFTDHLADTVLALKGRYVEVASVTNLRIDLPQGIPFSTDGVSWAMVGLADRDAILVRADVSAKVVDLPALIGCRESSPRDQGCNYDNGGFGPPTFALPTGQTIAVERGYLAVDAKVRGRDYRVFNTHVEERLLVGLLPETRLLQVFQAAELLGAAMNAIPPEGELIVMGDFNSDPADPLIEFGGSTYPTPYMIFASGGFTDTWTMRPQPGSGFSCCQAEDLSNRTSALFERIDLIWSLRRPGRVVDMKLLGNTMGDKTRPPGNGGLWPSDHAFVAAKLFFD
jgi:endonuclease/exonuclease/phosphatase family metal-dependent hydrolase